MKIKILLCLVFLALLLMLAFDFGRRFSQSNDAPMVSISIFDGVSILSTDFAIDARTMTGEVRLLSNDTTILVAGSNSISDQFLEYVSENVDDEAEYCGVMFRSISDSETPMVILEDARTYMTFAGNFEADLELFLEVLCGVKGLRNERGETK